jgi:hypothetical protein
MELIAIAGTCFYWRQSDILWAEGIGRYHSGRWVILYQSALMPQCR